EGAEHAARDRRERHHERVGVARTRDQLALIADERQDSDTRRDVGEGGLTVGEVALAAGLDDVDVVGAIGHDGSCSLRSSRKCIAAGDKPPPYVGPGGDIGAGGTMKSVEIDRSKRLKDQPTTGHNRFHPDVPPIVSVDEGEDVVLQTRDASDGQSGPATTEADMAGVEATAIHPLTGPVFVKGARPGDVLEVEFVDIIPEPHAFTAIIPGLGFLRDVFTTPYLVHWQIRDGWATSPKLPGVRIPGAPFMGVSGVAPTAAQVRAWTARENELMSRGGMVFPPDAAGAVPARGPAAS